MRHISNKNVRVTVLESVKGGIITGIGAGLGGGGIASHFAKEFLTLGEVLMDLKEEEKKKLCDLLLVAINIKIPALLSVLCSASDPTVVKIALEVVEEFLMKEKNLKVTY
ncbi:hypothetical protein Phum_PHUM600900 [Pediculus humanus corporis]|uniref:Uncharacterized protein n=1 Tax=Pediculus humanus subsp. corporis TaxID=121224 RepID=E0W335_PEDHC|nr:uncharacterized protein Phum_PHUM600900 [Pediculus humanus corporis]EEB20041.1 hypothetical protein Phum_PHUM600900 [Pediculus humanus corporis]